MSYALKLDVTRRSTSISKWFRGQDPSLWLLVQQKVLYGLLLGSQLDTGVLTYVHYFTNVEDPTATKLNPTSFTSVLFSWCLFCDRDIAPSVLLGGEGKGEYRFHQSCNINDHCSTTNRQEHWQHLSGGQNLATDFPKNRMIWELSRPVHTFTRIIKTQLTEWALCF